MDVVIELPEPHEGQKVVLEAAREARFIILACGRRWGKDTLLDMVIVPALLQGKRCAALLPRDVDADKVIERLKRLLYPAMEIGYVRFDGRRNAFKCESGGELRCYTVKNRESIRGSGLDLFVLNEAGEIASMCDLKSFWEKSVRAALIDRQGQAWFAGTPKGINGFYHFWERAKEGEAGWISFNFSSYDNPHLPPGEVDKMIKEEKLSRVAIEQEVFAKFIQDEGLVFTKIDEVCVLQPRDAHRWPRRACVIGVDIGGTTDYTAVSVMSVRSTPVNELQLYRWRTPQVRITEDRLLEICKEWMPAEVIIEANAIGEYFYQELAYRLSSRGIGVRRFVTTNETKADLIGNLRYAFENKQVLLLKDDVGQAELAAYNMTRTPTGQPRYGGAKGVHDDTVIARALAYQLSSRYTPPPNAERMRSEALLLSGNAWRSSSNVYTIEEKWSIKPSPKTMTSLKPSKIAVRSGW